MINNATSTMDSPISTGNKVEIPKINDGEILNTESICAIKEKALDCFNEILQMDNSLFKSPSDACQKKYSYLKKLKETAQKTEYINLVQLISLEMDKLKDSYSTNSHWLVMTTHLKHFQEVSPNLEILPNLTLNPYQIDKSIESIDHLNKTFEKVRGILQLVRLTRQEIETLENKKVSSKKISEEEVESIDSTIEKLTANIKIAEDYIDNLDFDQVCSALQQIKLSDRCLATDKALTDMVDKNGALHAAHFLKQNYSLEHKISNLKALLKDRHKKNSHRAVISFLKEWPTLEVFGRDHKDKFAQFSEIKNKTAAVKLLIEEKKNSDIKDDFHQLTCEYLLNFFDPTGTERFAYWNSKKIHISRLCLETANIMHSLQKYGIDHKPVLRQAEVVIIDTTPKKPANLPKDTSSLLKRIQEGKVKDDEIIWLAAYLKNHVVSLYSGVKFASGKEFEATFVAANDEVGKFGNKLYHFLEHAIEISGTAKGSENLFKGFLRLACELAKQGEFSLCTNIYSRLDGLAEMKKFSSFRKSKEMLFLEKLTDKSGNCKNMKDFISDKEKKNIFSLPYIGMHPSIIFGFSEARGRLGNNALEEIDKLPTAQCHDFYQKVFASTVPNTDAPKDEEDLDFVKPAKKHIICDWKTSIKMLEDCGVFDRGKASQELSDTVGTALRQEERYESYFQELGVKNWALQLFHRNPSWSNMKNELDLIGIIDSFVWKTEE